MSQPQPVHPTRVGNDVPGVRVAAGEVAHVIQHSSGEGSAMAKTTKTVTPKADRRKSARSIMTTSSAGDVLVNISESEIARRAFEMYCARGGGHGRALDDWLQAERELREAHTPHSS